MTRQARIAYLEPYMLMVLTNIAVSQSELARAVALAEESLKLFRQRNDVWGIQQGFGDLARIAHENLLLLRTIGSGSRLSEQATCRRR